MKSLLKACFLVLPILGLAAPLGAAQFKGRLFSADKPAAGVTVSAIPHETPFEEARREARRGPAPGALASTKTGADGSFSLAVPRDPAAPDHAFRLRADGAGLQSLLFPGAYDASESDDLGDRVLGKVEALAGRVVNETGAPVVGATVTLVAGGAGFLANSELIHPPHTVTTAADGTFRFDGASLAQNRLDIEAKGFARTELTSVRAGAMRPILLRPGLSLSGVVMRPDRKTPAAGALVRFEGKVTARWTEAAADGSFRLSDLPAGTGALLADGGEAGVAEVRAVSVPAAAGPKLSVVLSPSGTIEGRVVDTKTGVLVPRVRVEIASGGSLSLARTGPDGRYRVRGLRPERYELRADEPRYVPYVKNEIALEAGQTLQVDVPLTPGATLAGRVLDEKGAPVAGARGQVVREGGRGVRAILQQMRGDSGAAFRTGADGSFKASRLVPGDDQRLTVIHPDYERKVMGGLSLPAGGAKSDLSVVLSHGLAVTGVVQDQAKRPVAGAEIQFTPSASFGGGPGGPLGQIAGAIGLGGRPRLESGPDGHFEVKGLAKGGYVLTVKKAGFADQTLDPVKVEEAQPAAPVEVTLSAGASISGTIVQGNGQGAPGYIVRARPRETPGGNAFGFVSREPTGPDGLFTIEGLRSGETYDLDGMGRAGLAPRREGVAAPAEGIEIVVKGPGGIAGTVIDAQNGQALTDFDVSYEPDRSSTGPFGGRMGGGRARRRMLGMAAGLGNTKDPTIGPDGTYLIEDVPAGKWEVTAEAKGYQTGHVGGVVVEEGGISRGVEIKLVTGAAIRGRAFDVASGRGVAEAAISLNLSGGGGRGLNLPFAMGAPDATTDVDGNFVIEGLAPGTYRVAAHHPDYSDASEMVEVKNAPATTQLRLTPGSSLGGVVISDAGQPLPAVNVSLNSGGGGGFGGGFGGFGGLGGGNSTLTDETGRFRFDHLGPGRYRVVASMRGRSSTNADVILQPGESKDGVALTLSAGATIHGAVSGLSGAARGGVNVSASGPESYFGNARTSPDGLFQLTGAPIGAITLRAQAGDFLTSTRTAIAQVTIGEGQKDAEASIVFDVGFTVSGTVTREGQGVPDAMVVATRQGDGRMATARTGASGQYAMEGLAEGKYTVMAQPSQGGTPRRETVEVAADTTVDFVIPVGRIAGTVVEKGTAIPLMDATVGVDGGGRGATSDSNGRFAIEDLDLKAYNVTVRKPSYQFEKRQVTVEEQPSDLTFELVRGEGIGLQARDGIYGIPLHSLFAFVTDAQKSTVFNGSILLDGEGRGEIPSLKPGLYQVRLSSAGYASLTLPSVQAPSPTFAVVMTPGGAVEIHAGPETLALGAPRARLMTGSGQAYSSSTLSKPVTRMDHIVPGSYTLVVDKGASKPVVVTEGGVTVVQLP